MQRIKKEISRADGKKHLYRKNYLYQAHHKAVALDDLKRHKLFRKLDAAFREDNTKVQNRIVCKALPFENKLRRQEENGAGLRTGIESSDKKLHPG